MSRMVLCVKLGKELEGLPRPPFNGDLARRVFESVSKEAWNLWLAHARILINEYRLNMASAQAQDLLLKEMERFLFGEGSALPPEYVPPKPE